MTTYILYTREFGTWLIAGEYEEEFDAEIAALGYEAEDARIVKWELPL